MGKDHLNCDVGWEVLKLLVCSVHVLKHAHYWLKWWLQNEWTCFQTLGKRFPFQNINRSSSWSSWFLLGPRSSSYDRNSECSTLVDEQENLAAHAPSSPQESWGTTLSPLIHLLWDLLGCLPSSGAQWVKMERQASCQKRPCAPRDGAQSVPWHSLLSRAWHLWGFLKGNG